MREWPCLWYVSPSLRLLLYDGLTATIVRCNLTFLSIQEPGVSKFCSDCGTEYLDGALLGSHYDEDVRTTCQMLCDAFDVCIYCGGKFRP